MAHRAFRIRLSAAGASRRSSIANKFTQLAQTIRSSATCDAGAVLPGTRTLTRRRPLGCRGAPGTRLGSGLKRMRERDFPARFNPRPAKDGSGPVLPADGDPAPPGPPVTLTGQSERRPHPANKTPHERAPRWVG